MPHNIHNVLSDVYELLRMNGTAVVHTWTIEYDADQRAIGVLTLRLDRDRCLALIPHCIRWPVQVCKIRISRAPDQTVFLEENTLFRGHDITQLMNLLNSREIEF